MHEPSAAPPVAEGGIGLLPVAVLVVAATFAGYASLLGHWFYSDDFVHLLHTRDLGVGGLVRFLLFADYGERPWVYWRPGWIALFASVRMFADATPWPYHLVSVVLHAVVAVVVSGIARRMTGSLALALAAGLCFALLPSHCEAVAWISAAYNVLPAGLCLAVAGFCSWRFAQNGSAGAGVATVLFVWVSLTFKEAAYASPVVLVAAFVCAHPIAWRRLLLAFVPIVLAVVWHYFARSTRTATAGTADAIVVAFVHHLAMFLRGVVPWLPANDYLAVVVPLVVAVPLAWLASPTARFLLLWSGAAMLPYVVMTHGERFAYFFHVPVVLFAMQASADLARRWRWQRGPAVLGALWSLVAVYGALSLPSALEPHRQRGEECQRIWKFVDEHGLVTANELIVDAVPLSLENGFEAMLDLFGGRRPRVVQLQIVPRPPFLLYLNRAFGEMPDTTPVLQFGTGDQPRAIDKATLVQGFVPLPILSLAGDYELVADEEAARAALQRPDCDAAIRPLLFAAPPCRIEPPGDYSIDDIAVDLRESTFAVDCARHTLLTIAFPVAVDFERDGRILIDGQPVPVLRANLMFHAVCLPPGRHRITLRPALAGG